LKIPNTIQVWQRGKKKEKEMPVPGFCSWGIAGAQEFAFLKPLQLVLYLRSNTSWI
jgi:hypothetical protein